MDPKQTKLSVTGIDRQKVGQVAAEMRSLRPPDPYKNKGVRYAGERLKKKVGKTGSKIVVVGPWSLVVGQPRSAMDGTDRKLSRVVISRFWFANDQGPTTKD